MLKLLQTIFIGLQMSISQVLSLALLAEEQKRIHTWQHPEEWHQNSPQRRKSISTYCTRRHIWIFKRLYLKEKCSKAPEYLGSLGPSFKDTFAYFLKILSITSGNLSTSTVRVPMNGNSEPHRCLDTLCIRKQPFPSHLEKPVWLLELINANEVLVLHESALLLTRKWLGSSQQKSALTCPFSRA